MSGILKLIFLCMTSWSFQVLQKTNEVVIVGEGKSPEQIIVREGDLKISIDEIKYDILAQTEIKFVDDAIELKNGDFRLRNNQLSLIKIKTPVAMITSQANDIVMHYDPIKAIASADVLEGSALIQGLYREEILNLQAGERGQFIGVAESDGPAFDFLLKGRKSIRGNINGPEKLTDENLKIINTQYDIKLRPNVKKVIPKAKPGQICKIPFAKFNECVWRCQNNPKNLGNCQVDNPHVVCTREKCLANGEWGDKLILYGAAKKSCQSLTNQVGTCNY